MPSDKATWLLNGLDVLTGRLSDPLPSLIGRSGICNSEQNLWKITVFVVELSVATCLKPNCFVFAIVG